MRDNNYLTKKLQEIWSRYFWDTPPCNEVEIYFSRKAKRRLGYIKSKRNTEGKTLKTKISLNGHFRHKEVPEYVLLATIAHEICHYIHGIGSPLPSCIKHPHRGGVVDEEMAKRGLRNVQRKERKWLNKNWKSLVAERSTIVDSDISY